MGLEAIPILLPLPIPLAVVAVASGVETALFSLTYHDRLRLKRLSPRSAAAVAYLLARPRTLLVLVLFITMAASTVYFALTSLALLASEAAWVKITLAAVNLLLMTLVGEIISKVLAARYRVEVCRLAAPWVLYAFRAVQPFLIAVERGLVSPLVRVITPERTAEGLTEEELDALLHQGSAEGAIDADERRVLSQVIRLSGLRVRDVMTHRMDMQWIDDAATHAEVAALVREKRVTRLPVVKEGEEIDQGVLGLLDVKRYLAAAAAGGGAAAKVTDSMDPVKYVPGSASLDKLLEEFRNAGTKLGVVVDEHGGVVGIVSTENIVQRLIVELTRDEELEIEQQVTQLADGRWSVPGRLSVREWAAMFGLVGGRSGGGIGPRVSTVGGLIFNKLGRVPRTGDAVTVGNLRLEVLSMAPVVGGTVGRVVSAAAVSLIDGGQRRAGQGASALKRDGGDA